MIENFADKLLRAMDGKQNVSCTGLDPDVEFIPEEMKERYLKEFDDTKEAVAGAFEEHNRILVDAVHEIVPVVKLQIAMYECYGAAGIQVFQNTIDYARKHGLVVLEDGKRNDIGNTSQKYSDGHLGEVTLLSGRKEPNFDVDALTVNCYIGSDCIKPFIKDCVTYGKGIFILDKTSNPSAPELQDLKVGNESIRLSEYVAQLINEWGEGTEGELGYRPIGAVVGATFHQDAQVIRQILNRSIFLVPGYETQGGKPVDIPYFLNDDGRGAAVNASRYFGRAHMELQHEGTYADKIFKSARERAILMKDNINKALKNAKKCRW